jgi:protein SCO1
MRLEGRSVKSICFVDTVWRTFRLGSVFVVLLSMALLVGGCSRPHEFAGTSLEQPHPAPDFAGTNWNGVPFRLQDLRGKAVLLFFGYTTCPDICPLTLAEIQQVKQQLGEQADKLAVVFVTVDPAQDTVEHLAQYVPSFDPTFYGVRLDEATLATTQKAYGIYAENVTHEAHAPAADHIMAHSGYTLAIDPLGNWRAVYASDIEATAIVEDVRYLVSE